MRKRHFRSVLRVLALFAVLVPFASERPAAWQTSHHGFEGRRSRPGSGSPMTAAIPARKASGARPLARVQRPDAVHARGGMTPYNYNTCTWMRYGPFSLGGATNARMMFQSRLDSEVGYDFFSWAYSCNGVGEWTGRRCRGTLGCGPAGTSR